MAIMTVSTTAAELRLKDALKKEGLQFEEQYRVYEKGNSYQPKYVIDFLVTKDGIAIAVECDSFSYHSSDRDIEFGITRDAWLEASGYTVLHFTASQLIYEMDAVLQIIKKHLDNESATVNPRALREKKVKTTYVVNCREKKLHSVSLYYSYTQVNDKLWLAYKFRDNTLKKCSEERVQAFFNVPERTADILAVYTALRDLKRSVSLTVYCSSGWLTEYANRTIERPVQQRPLLKKIDTLLERHNYLFKHVNRYRGPEYYHAPKAEYLIAHELRGRCLQMRHDETKLTTKARIDFEEIEKLL